ncbi:unnamed protein product [Rhizophagus irregularis]|nr:unnamed protein product [Rhizophagus irregularis]
MAVNIPLSLNSYKPKKWAYVTFRSQQVMDAAMEQSVAFQGGMLQWEFPKDINKLCHRCGKLGCAPAACPMNNSRGRSRARNPIAHLKERFNIGQGSKTSSANHTRQRSRSQSKERSTSRHRNNSDNNSGRNKNSSAANSNVSKAPNNSAQRPRSNERRNKDRSVSFSASERNDSNNTSSNGHKSPLIDSNSSQIQEILSILKSLQEDMANVRARVHALELADQRTSRLEERVFGHKFNDIPAPPDPNDSSGMLIDDHQRTPPYITQSNRPTSSMSLSDPVLPPPMAPIPRTTITSTPIPAFADEATINKERTEIYSFQRSLDALLQIKPIRLRLIRLSSSFPLPRVSYHSALMLNNNTDYDTFVRNPPNPADFNDIFNDPLSDSLFSNSSFNSSIPDSFTISSFNVNGLKTPGQGAFKIDQISSFFSQKHISFGGIVDTHLSPKQMKFLSKRVSGYTSFHSDLDPQKHGRSSGLRIFVVYIPPTNDMVLRNEVIDHLISLISLATTQGFYHAICGDFNMNLDKYYPIYTQQPQAASQRVHRLFHHLLSHGYEDYTPLNLAPNLGTYRHLDTITRIDFVWSCPLLCRYMLTASIFDAHDMHISDHNPIITYFDASLLSDAIKPARARQLGRDTRRVFKFDSVSTEQWTMFADELDNLCSIGSTAFGAWPLNQKCEYIHSRIIKAAKSKLPSVTVGNTYTPKKPKDLESLIQSYRFLSKVAKTIRLLHKTPTLYSSRYESKWTTYLIRLNNICLAHKNIFTTSTSLPSFLYEGRNDDFASLLKSLENMTLLLRGLLLLKEREFQTSSIQAKIDARNDNFTNDVSAFIDSALSRTRRRIVLDRVFVDHPTRPTLLTSPDAIDKEVIDHFQNFVPITSSPPSSICDLPDRWSNVYKPLVDVNSNIFGSLMDPPTLEEWSSTISSMPNDKAPGPSMISYEMLKHLGPHASSLLLDLVGTCLSDANIPDLWRHATVFPIPKPHEWKCQLKNTRPITLLEVIRKALVKLFYNRLAPLLASHNVLQGGNFAGLPGGFCRDPIITLESIIHDSVVTKHPLWILSQDISKAFDSVDLSMLKFALQRLRLPNNAIQFILLLFMARSNRVITAHGLTPSYRVRIGIDQGEVISPLLWVIYIDPLLTVLKNEKMDPYSLVSPSIPTALSSGLSSFEDLHINNLVFMDDSTLVSSSKAGMEHMLSITEEFYWLNNTSANHNKYVLATNAISVTQDLSPIVFNLTPFSLNATATITVTPIPMSSSFRFLGVWFLTCSKVVKKCKSLELKAKLGKFYSRI